MKKKDIELELSKNPNIERNIRKIVENAYGNIYNFLEERNFKCWLFNSNIPKIARTTIYKVLEDKEFKDKVIGEYKFKNKDGLTQIVLREKIGINERTIAHETYHAFVDGLGGFNDFFGEGITEYLSKQTYHDMKRYSYKPNVDVVELLDSMYPNKIIKSYLTKRGRQYFFECLKNIDKKQSDIVHDIKKEIDYHCEKFTRNNLNDDLYTIVNDCMRLYYIYQKDRIKNLRHIRKGKINFNGYMNKMARIYLAYEKLPRNNEFFDFMNNKLIEEMVINSHLLIGKNDNEKLELMKKIKINVNIGINEKINAGRAGKEIKEYGNIDQSIKPYSIFNKDSEKKLEEKFLNENKDTSNFQEVMKNLENLVKATGMNEEKISSNLNRLGIRNEKDTKNFMIVTKKYEKCWKNLNELSYEYEKNLEKPTFIEIELDALPGKNVYFEKLDGRNSLVIVSPNSGNVERVNMFEKNNNIPEIGIEIKRKITNELEYKNVPKSNKILYEIKDIRKNIKSEIEFLPISQRVKIKNGKNLNKRNVLMKDIKDKTFKNIVFQNIESKVKRNEYINKEKQNYEKNIENKKTYNATRQNRYAQIEINVEEFIGDYKKSEKVVKGIDENKTMFKALSQKLIDSAYNIKNSEVIDYKEKQRYEETKKDMVENMEIISFYNGDGIKNIARTKLRQETKLMNDMLLNRRNINRRNINRRNKENIKELKEER